MPKQLAHTIPLPPADGDSDKIALKSYLIRELAALLDMHRNTLAKEMKQEFMLQELSKLGYRKGKRKLSKPMVRFCSQFGYEVEK